MTQKEAAALPVYFCHLCVPFGVSGSDEDTGENACEDQEVNSKQAVALQQY